MPIYSIVIEYELEKLLLDVDWYLPGDILQVRDRGVIVRILSSPLKTYSNFAYKVNTTGPLYRGDMLSICSDVKSVLNREKSDKLFRIKYDSELTKSRKSDDFDTFVTNALLSPISPINIWNSDDDSSYSDNDSSYSDDSGSSDSGGGDD
jgi:hypothetical protein